MAKNSINAIPLQSVDAATFGVGGYSELTPLGGLGKPCFYIKILNNCDEDIFISYDGGITDNDILRSLATLELPFQSQSQPNNNVCKFPANFQIWVDSVSGTVGVGDVYLSAYYQNN